MAIIGALAWTFTRPSPPAETLPGKAPAGGKLGSGLRLNQTGWAVEFIQIGMTEDQVRQIHGVLKPECYGWGVGNPRVAGISTDNDRVVIVSGARLFRDGKLVAWRSSPEREVERLLGQPMHTTDMPFIAPPSKLARYRNVSVAYGARQGDDWLATRFYLHEDRP